MNPKLLIALLAGTMAQAHAAAPEKFWERCPGPACPASTAPTEYERAAGDNGRRPADDQMKAGAPVKESADKAAPKKAEPKAAKPAQDLRMKGY